ncbi:MAG: CPBP family intramembrane glutamic endopeptidase [Chitinophagales bacterium]
MKEIFGYIRDYFKHVNKKLLALCTLQTAILVFLNFHNRLEWWLTSRQILAWPEFFGHYVLFAAAFIFPYLYYWSIAKNNSFINKPFIILLVVAPAIFSLKMALQTELPFSNDEDWNEYWNRIYYWPVRLLIIISILLLVWKTYDNDQPFYGLTTKKFKWQPYVIMLLCMLPLIAAASTQADFLAVYPKLRSVLHFDNNIHLSWFHKLLFELSYGSDFLGIEIFFRGFLILGFIKWVGKDAILPMACFYCTIHFGKPLGECISSYFGGILLGIVVYNTRSIYGGLIVHLGIAWLMEIGGYIHPLSP